MIAAALAGAFWASSLASPARAAAAEVAAGASAPAAVARFAADPAEDDTSTADPATASGSLRPTQDGSPVGPSDRGGARLFETWELVGEAGLFLPLGRLAGILDPAPSLGLRLVSSYYGAWRAWIAASGARLDGPESPAEVAFLSGAAGLEWRAASPWIPAPGLGLAFHYARALSKDRGADEYLFLEDGESEFGSRASLAWTVPLGEAFALSAGARWETMFTAPAYGHALAFHLGAAWRR